LDDETTKARSSSLEVFADFSRWEKNGFWEQVIFSVFVWLLGLPNDQKNVNILLFKL
jgi:hypothetical protein